jgi:hypothetical protein
MALYMIGFITYGATLVFYAAIFPRLARNTPHSRKLRDHYETGEVDVETYELEESLEKNRISNISAVRGCIVKRRRSSSPFASRCIAILGISLRSASIFRCSCHSKTTPWLIIILLFCAYFFVVALLSLIYCQERMLTGLSLVSGGVRRVS